MGKIFKVTAKLYSDQNFTTLIQTISDIKIGIPIGDTTSVSFQNIGSNYIWYVSRIVAEDWVGLGGTYYVNPGITFPQNKIPSMFFPGCTAVEVSYPDTAYLEYVFSNGFYMRLSAPIGHTGGPTFNFYDNNNVLIGTSGTLSLFYPITGSSGSPRYTALVASSMNADGTIPDSATLAYYRMNGQYGDDMWGSIDRINNANATILRNFFNGIPGWVYDPYEPAGNSEPGGGDGDGDDDSESNPPSPLPTDSFVDTGFCRAYNPNKSQLQALARYLWTDTTFLQTVANQIVRMLEDPMDAIISLSLVPCAVPNGAPETVKVMFIPTNVSMPPVTNQFVDVDCGTLTVNKYIGSALDYNPYTRIHAYLPYIGQVTLNTDEVMGKTLHLFYRIDVITGICAAYIEVNGDVMYVFSGHCSVSQPISAADFSSYLNAMITAAKSVAAVTAGAVGAPGVAAGLIGGPAPRSVDVVESLTTTARNEKTGRQITTGTEQYRKVGNTGGASFGELSAKAASNTVSSVVNSKFLVDHTNGFGGNSGYLAQRRPFVIIERARLCNPKEYGTLNGYPSMLYRKLGDIKGYTEVQKVHLTGFTATNPELSEISELLKSGVIL